MLVEKKLEKKLERKLERKLNVEVLINKHNNILLINNKEVFNTDQDYIEPMILAKLLKIISPIEISKIIVDKFNISIIDIFNRKIMVIDNTQKIKFQNIPQYIWATIEYIEYLEKERI